MTASEQATASRPRILMGALALAFGVGWSLTDWARPGLALAVGILVALLVGNPIASAVSKKTKFFLKLCVVGLGFGVPLSLVRAAGVDGFVATTLGVVFAVAAGLFLIRILGVQQETGWLITIGTAICGGSAIAALGTAIKARTETMAVALGTVFILNAVALWVFPPIGESLSLSQAQFGVWASIAIHDTASVVGAAAEVGDEALDLATVLKLLRTLWILPLVIAAVHWRTRNEDRAGGASWRQAVPLFIVFFALAALAAATLPAFSPLFQSAAAWSRRLLTTVLFLIGTTLSRDALRIVGARPLFLAVALWILVSVVSLLAVRAAF